jgi:hypothetical protein
MIAKTRVLLLTALIPMLSQVAMAQVDFVSQIQTENRPGNCKPPKNRELFHDYINSEQRKILRSDGKMDDQYTPTPDDQINFILTRTLTGRVDALQCKIEGDSTLSPQNKVKYLRGVENVLKFFNSNTAAKKVKPVLLPEILKAYENCMQADREGKSIEKIIEALPYETAYSIVKADRTTFEKNAGFRSIQNLVVLKFCILYPEQIFPALRDNPEVPFADSLIKIVAKQNPTQLYNYAQANNRLGTLIRNIKDDPFVSTVAKMARSRSGQQYFPFLDNIVRGKLTIADIEAIENDSLAYYRLLVKTHLDYRERLLNKDTAYAYKELEDRLVVKARDVFVNTINALHDVSNPAIRFKIIQPLTAEELYYLAVSTDGLIYTSSFVKGVYPLMMSRAPGKRGDSLLMAVKFDRYRKFIKMAAGYNTLSDFLASFQKKERDDESNAEKLMRAFVGRLEESGGLEDGVDVADSYASIMETMKPLADQMLQNIRANYDRNVSENNRRGMVMYRLLNTLFLSADTNNHIDVSKEFGISPVYVVPFNELTDKAGTVIMQVFMYGDKDGIGVYPSIINLFNNSGWRIDQKNPQWVTIKSVKGKPISIYINRPLPEESNKDAEAQKALCEYLEKNKLFPTITINRGHSYNAPYTIEQMFPSSKIMFMGSCGGYRLINDILQRAPDAHIIGTKQVADAPVNNPFLKLISEKLRNGDNIEWIPFWKELEKMANSSIFEDYVPPHKNLGAIFIKAYKIAIEKEDHLQL